MPSAATEAPARLGRPPLPCPPALVSVLGTVGDREIAESAGVAAPTVRRWREERGILPWRRRAAVEPLHAHPARSVLPVAAEIAAMPRPKPSPEVLEPMAEARHWTADELDELARRVAAGETSAVIAVALGRSLKSVANARLQKLRPAPATAAEPASARMKLINARIPVGLYEAIEARAEAKGVIVSATIRELLEAGAAALGMTS